MEEDENTFPMDFYVGEASPRPWKFRPEGHLVVILPDTDEGARSVAALVDAGFAGRDMKLYTDTEILENYKVFSSRRGMTDKVIGSFIDDLEGRELYLAYARQGACALWVRLPDEATVPKALRVLADCQYTHARYYGFGKQEDFRIV